MPGKYILMLENDNDDRYITQSTLRELNIFVPVRYEFYSPSLTSLLNEVPALILVAYNAVTADRLDIIEQFKSKNEYKKVPFVFLVEDISKEEIIKYYEAGANTVIKKPSRDSDTRRKIEVFFKYWFEVAEL